MSKQKVTVGGVIGSVITILVGIMVMSQMCPITLKQVANNPSAVSAASKVCSIFFQNAPNLVPNP